MGRSSRWPVLDPILRNSERIPASACSKFLSRVPLENGRLSLFGQSPQGFVQADYCRASCFGNRVANGGRRVSVAQLVSIPSAEPFSMNALNIPATHGPFVWCP